MGVALLEPYVYVADHHLGLIILEYYGPTSIDSPGDRVGNLPKTFTLSQNYPNPFNPSTTIQYDIAATSGTVPVEINIYNIRGRLVRKLVDQEKEPGRYQVQWDGHDEQGRAVSSGVYLYRLETGNFISTRKMVMLE
jgi:hypothetical protein